MPLTRFAVALRRHPRALRVLVGLVVMTALFATLLSAAEPRHAHGVDDTQAQASGGRLGAPVPGGAGELPAERR